LNYADHAAETGAPIPERPIVFAKGTSTLIGPDDDVVVPPGSTTTDYEVELAVVVGAPAYRLGSPDEALAAVAGYAVANDVSERELQLQLGGGQWYLGKSCPAFNPLGPWLVPADEVPDPQALSLSLSVNGEVRQQSTTAQMIFGVAHVVWYLSQHLLLEPGDVINTGTPGGVALARPDHPYLRGGDVVELTVEGLGTQRQRVVQG
jgi:2-keto-4-pentenoate hydratase/2-oxohepta-3-ene-1,7-dioic acid hydratase in catechol pathway